MWDSDILLFVLYYLIKKGVLFNLLCVLANYQFVKEAGGKSIVSCSKSGFKWKHLNISLGPDCAC